ncbi:hypothetical protein [Aulosira sp. FACHB-615]|uniref:hypothetical protein n=1 Tax=Aulosira sp. FACHB-615 TaxID=2692777 RepID=UPI00168A3A8A|nr:hypothetical protein [Aulosira sp. FACHB-615]MBD2490565.1 hypothetical protein [Aulosira sp. FACHB-615]
MTQFAAQFSSRDGLSLELLYHVDPDGVEYFTVIATGQSGMSQSGLAKFLGVHDKKIASWIKRVQQADPLNNSLPKCLKLFAGNYPNILGYFDYENRNILSDSFCIAIIEYYASYSKQVNKESQAKAKQALKLISCLGMQSFIHQKTGWKPNDLSSSTTNIWWQKIAGTFADNSAYDQAMQLGREYRESLHSNLPESHDI